MKKDKTIIISISLKESELQKIDKFLREDSDTKSQRDRSAFLVGSTLLRIEKWRGKRRSARATTTTSSA